MFMYLQKNKKGFTLIELMVVVAIIGILALLGLRLYTGQQTKAKESIVKANAGTVQTLIQSELADGNISDIDTLVSNWNDSENALHAGMRNPFNDAEGVIEVTETDISDGAPSSTTKGIVYVYEKVDEIEFKVRGYGEDGLLPDVLTAKK
jgi:prepilin-type N-terminal cleavage/methylation domain-containing protein